MYLVRNRLLNSQNDDEYLAIANTFTNNAFKVFIQFATETVQDGKEILNFLKVGKLQSSKNVIDKYGALFLEEFSHFMRIYRTAINSS